jgi:trehalose 6-phosphate phosphatase
VSAPSTDTLSEVLRPLTSDPRGAAILLDVDGTLAPIVRRADAAQVGPETARLLGGLARRYGCVACISGRSVADARRVVGVGGIAYAGSHGAELLEPGGGETTVMPEFADWTQRIRRFAREHADLPLRRLKVTVEDKGPIAAFHWREAPDEYAARKRIDAIAAEAEEAGLWVHWGRKVMEIRPPVPVDKGRAVDALLERSGAHAALYAGDDVTDLDAFAALDAALADGRLDAAVRIGIRSDEAPDEIFERTDLAVEGIPGFTRVLEALSRQ